MGAGKKPGSLCVTTHEESVDDGTSCRHSSPAPNPVGTFVHELVTISGAAMEWALAEGQLITRALGRVGSNTPGSSSVVFQQSGGHWVSQFPTSTSVDDLTNPFRDNVARFISALRDAGATVEIAATFRPPQRAYLMHFSFAIARESANPRSVPSLPGVNIQWAHSATGGKVDLKASKLGAEEMVQGYEIVYRPALTSRHTEGKAIDMNIKWDGNLSIVNGKGKKITISSTPRSGSGNNQLHQVGASYGVVKLLSDAPHWSSDGH